MITCDLIGRLGNQLFILAAAKAHSLDVNTGFAMPAQSLNPAIWPRYFYHLPVYPRNTSPRHTWKEPSHEYTPIPQELRDVKLHGFFQSEKYFKHHREEILQMFGFPPIQQTFKCAIHIRLGDYLQFQDKHPIVSEEYLNEAIRYVKMISGIDDFLVFSDDIKRARMMIEHLQLPYEFEYMPSKEPVHDLKTMAGCVHQICSNSSYSWWASWINPYEGKIVVMPKVWFGEGNSHLETKDIYPEGAVIL